MIASTTQDIGLTPRYYRIAAAFLTIMISGLFLSNVVLVWNEGKFRQIYHDMLGVSHLPFTTNLVIDYPALFLLLALAFSAAAIVALRKSQRRRLAYMWVGLSIGAWGLLAFQVLALFMPLLTTIQVIH